MVPSIDPPASDRQVEDGDRTEFMSPDLLRQVEAALRKVGDFGVVRLVVAEGRVRLIEATQTKGIGELLETLEESPTGDSFGRTIGGEASGES